MGSFDATSPYWKHADDLASFWLIASVLIQSLGKLALRIFKAPCNSVPSERAFSIQNLIHTKCHNQLQSEKVNKLTYIYINSRVLDLKSLSLNSARPSTLSNTIKRSPTDLTEAELIQLEGELLEEEGISDYESVDSDYDSD